MEPKLLILDEPTSSLDASVQKQIIKLLIDLQKDLNLSYLFISHDLELVSTISHRMVVMKDGMIGLQYKIITMVINIQKKLLMGYILVLNLVILVQLYQVIQKIQVHFFVI